MYDFRINKLYDQKTQEKHIAPIIHFLQFMLKKNVWVVLEICNFCVDSL